MSESAATRRLAARILTGLALGVGLGLAAGILVPESGRAALDWWIDGVIQPAGRVFLRIIFMVVVPLTTRPDSVTL